tara:strand:- start:185 stop:601 length:417 start_codon:yes stop_codon:yes gene_type:complete
MTKIKATKGEFVQMVNSLFSVKDLEGKDFAINVAKNISILTEALKDIEKAGKPSKEFMDLALSVNAFTNKKDDEEAIYKVQELEKENKELIDKRREQIAAVSVMMEDELELELFPIQYDMLPDNITATQISGLTKIIG